VSGDGGDPGECAEAMPLQDPMGADEVMTWIALRKAIPIDTSPRGGSWQSTVYRLSRHWPFPDMAFYKPHYAQPLPLVDRLAAILAQGSRSEGEGPELSGLRRSRLARAGDAAACNP
jgi:hypothetical protein